MTEALWHEAERYSIPVYDGYQVIEILTEKIGNEKRVRGALAVNVRAMGLEEMYAVFSAENIVYATGGEAGMYETSVYPSARLADWEPR